MYSLTVRRHAFIAHSLKRDIFGPARLLHGVTLIVDAEFQGALHNRKGRHLLRQDHLSDVSDHGAWRIVTDGSFFRPVELVA